MSGAEVLLQPHEDGRVSLYVGAGEVHMLWPDAVELAGHMLTTAAIAAHWVGATRDTFDGTASRVLYEARDLLDQLAKRPEAPR